MNTIPVCERCKKPLQIVSIPESLYITLQGQPAHYYVKIEMCSTCYSNMNPKPMLWKDLLIKSGLNYMGAQQWQN